MKRRRAPASGRPTLRCRNAESTPKLVRSCGRLRPVALSVLRRLMLTSSYTFGPSCPCTSMTRQPLPADRRRGHFARHADDFRSVSARTLSAAVALALGASASDALLWRSDGSTCSPPWASRCGPRSTSPKSRQPRLTACRSASPRPTHSTPPASPTTLPLADVRDQRCSAAPMAAMSCGCPATACSASPSSTCCSKRPGTPAASCATTRCCSIPPSQRATATAAAPIAPTAPQISAARCRARPPPSCRPRFAAERARSCGAGSPDAAGRQPRCAPAAATQQVTVQTGDTASKIAGAYKPADVSLDQMLVALLRANPNAFIGGNVNRIRPAPCSMCRVRRRPAACRAAEAKPAP